MNYNQALTCNVLIQELIALRPADPKVMTEAILLRIHYAKAQGEWTEAMQTLTKENTDEEVKREVIEKKAVEEMQLPERRMSAELFEGVVAAAMGAGTIRTSLLQCSCPEGEDPATFDPRAEIPAAEWLTFFAQNLVEE